MPILFDEALKFVLKQEGGYSNHPADKGGATNKGIIQSVYNRYRRDKNLSIRSVKDIEDKEPHNSGLIKKGRDLFWNFYHGSS